MGRNSVDATNASLIRAVRAIRCAFVPCRRAFRREAEPFPPVLDLPAPVLLETLFFT
jgi:hypothetical protein